MTYVCVCDKIQIKMCLLLSKMCIERSEDVLITLDLLQLDDSGQCSDGKKF